MRPSVLSLVISLALLPATFAAAQTDPGLRRLPPVGDQPPPRPWLAPQSEELLPPVVPPDNAQEAPLEAEEVQGELVEGELVEEELVEGELVEEEEVVEYMWFDPHYWFRPPFWEGSLELGINGTEGNSETFSFKAGASLKRTSEFHVLGFDFNYARTTADSVETQHNALLRAEYERLFGDASPWSLFVRNILEYDEFRAFDVRQAVNTGVAYRFLRTERIKLKGRFGAGASREYGGPNNEWSPEAVFGADYEHQLTKKQKLALTVDYFPEWTNFSDFRLLTVFSWEVVLDRAANMHLKLAINDQYDSTPEGRRPNDLNYSLLLLWKL